MIERGGGDCGGDGTVGNRVEEAMEHCGGSAMGDAQEPGSLPARGFVRLRFSGAAEDTGLGRFKRTSMDLVKDIVPAGSDSGESLDHSLKPSADGLAKP